RRVLTGDLAPVSWQMRVSPARRSGAFEVTSSDASTLGTRGGLSRFDAVVFFTTGELPMSADQKSALIDFVRSGKGFVGIHSATDTFYQWPEYGAMLGAYFDGHPWHQQVTIRVEDPAHAATASLPPSFQIV